MAQICTTREQSRRLIGLGIKSDTADTFFPINSSFPAWSLGALIDLMPNVLEDKRFEATYYLTIGKDYVSYSNRMEDEECEFIFTEGNLIDCCIYMIESLVLHEYL